MQNLEERMDRIEQKLDALLAQLRAGGGAARNGATNGGAASGGPEVASDADLDGPRGNPEVRFSPRRWSGADHKGRRFSDCEPEFLDMLAEAYEWFAQRDDESGAVDKNGTPKSRWSRLDASRARGWAARLRNNNGGNAGAKVMSRPSPNANGGASGRRNNAPPPRPAHDMDAPFEVNDDEIPF